MTKKSHTHTHTHTHTHSISAASKAEKHAPNSPICASVVNSTYYY